MTQSAAAAFSGHECPGNRKRFADRGAQMPTAHHRTHLEAHLLRSTGKPTSFVSRLLEEEGITYFFKQEDEKVTLVLVDDMASYETIPTRVSCHPFGGNERQIETITQWSAEQELQPTQYSLDYNYLKRKRPAQASGRKAACDQRPTDLGLSRRLPRAGGRRAPDPDPS
jgi:hypothetical protein